MSDDKPDTYWEKNLLTASGVSMLFYDFYAASITRRQYLHRARVGRLNSREWLWIWYDAFGNRKFGNTAPTLKEAKQKVELVRERMIKHQPLPKRRPAAEVYP